MLGINADEIIQAFSNFMAAGGHWQAMYAPARPPDGHGIHVDNPGQAGPVDEGLRMTEQTLACDMHRETKSLAGCCRQR